MGLDGSHEKTAMNTFSNMASNYRGRLLLNVECREPIIANNDGMEVMVSSSKPHRRPWRQGGDNYLKRNEYPPAARWNRGVKPFVLRMFVLAGSDIPKCVEYIKAPKFTIEVTMGNQVLATKACENKDGMVAWLMDKPLEMELDWPVEAAATWKRALLPGAVPRALGLHTSTDARCCPVGSPGCRGRGSTSTSRTPTTRARPSRSSRSSRTRSSGRTSLCTSGRTAQGLCSASSASSAWSAG